METFFGGRVSFHAGVASVLLTDQATGNVIADAVMFAPPGAGPNSAIWTPNVAQAGQYEVYARWTANPNRDKQRPLHRDSCQRLAVVPVDQKTSGGTWNLLGTFTLSPGTAHKVTLPTRPTATSLRMRLDWFRSISKAN